MDLYVWRLMRLGFSEIRAYTVCMKYRHDKALDELDRHISDLEESWRTELCG